MAVMSKRVPKNNTARLLKDVKAEVRGDIKNAKKYHLPWWAILLIIAGTIPLCFLFDHFGKLNLVMPTLVSVFVIDSP